MPWLEQRGESLIASHHPLRETLISQLGPDPGFRHQTLARRPSAASVIRIKTCKLGCCWCIARWSAAGPGSQSLMRSEEHTSELQSLRHLVCRLLLEKK